METETLRLHYAAAIACGVLGALAIHILLTVLDHGLGAVLRAAPDNTAQMTSALAWWAIAAAGFLAGWASGAYLIAASRGRAAIAVIARRFLIAVVVAVCTAAGVLSKAGGLGGGLDVLTNLAALAVAVLSAYCGARFAYLRAEHA